MNFYINKCKKVTRQSNYKKTMEVLKMINEQCKKQMLLENILDMFLTSKQIKEIENGWKTFYNDPMQYKNSVVVDMVKLSLK